MGIIRRAYPFEFKASTSEDDAQRGSGFAAVFNNVDSYQDVIQSGAFTKSIKRKGAKGVKFLWQHNSDEPIGVTTALEERKKGLYIEWDFVTEVTRAREARALAKAGAVDGLSIGYTVPKGGSDFDQEKGIRYLKEIDLWEVSLVTFPANPRALVSGVKQAQTVRELEAALRDEGFSWSDAKHICSLIDEHRLPLREEGDANLLKLINYFSSAIARI